MKIRVTLVIVLGVLLTSCGANKRTLGSKVKTRSAGTYTTTGEIKAPMPDASELFPLPDDPGYFLKYSIGSTKEYIDAFAEIAQYEMKAFGIPASITLAQGILESGSGNGGLTKKTNNHFGIKCHQGWQGEYALHDDDAKGECFRKYNHPMFSFRDHSIFLSARSRYGFLFNYRRDDYKKWAKGLKQAGYATDPKYPQKLITLIERYQLDQYDEQVIKDGLEPVREPQSYEVLTHIVEKGDTLYAIARQYTTSIEDIKNLNSLDNSQLSVGQVLNIRRIKSK